MNKRRYFLTVSSFFILLGISLFISPNFVDAATLAAPKFSIPAGKYSKTISVEITAPVGANIRYLTSGLAPSCKTGSVYSSPIKIGTDKTIKAVSCKGTLASAVSSVEYIFLQTQQYPSPTPSLQPGSYVSPQVLKFSAVGASSIRYYEDDATAYPGSCAKGVVYKTPYILLSESNTLAKSVKIKAFACYAGGVKSPDINLSYTINPCTYGLRFNDDGVKQTVPTVKCFNSNWQSKIPTNSRFEVFQNVAPPVSENDDTFKYFPATTAYTMRKTALIKNPAQTVMGVNKGLFVWSNRCQKMNLPGAKCDGLGYEGNPVYGSTPDKAYRSFFSSVKRADTCTIAQATGAFGANSTTIKNSLAANKLSLVTTDEELETVSKIYSATSSRINLAGSKEIFDEYMKEKFNRENPWIVDTCFIPELGSSSPVLTNYVNTMVLDHEVGDRRTPAEAAAYFKELTSKLKALKPNLRIMLFNNDWTQAGSEVSGLNGTNGKDVYKAFDLLIVWAWPAVRCANRVDSIEESMDKQIKEITSNYSIPNLDYKKFIVVADLADDDTTVGRKIHNYIISKGLAGTFLFRDNTVQSTCDVNDPKSNVGNISKIIGVTPNN